MVPRRSNRTIAINFINNLSLLLGLSAFFSWVYFSLRIGSWILILYMNPLVDLGLILLSVSLCKHILCLFFPRSKKLVTFLASLHMLEFIIIIYGFMVFAMVATHKGDGRKIAGRVYKEYHKDDYSNLLHSYAKTFGIYIQALYRLNTCTNFSKKFNHLTVSEFYNTNLTPLESGCCKPPSYCHFEYKNATIWRRVSHKFDMDRDCDKWDHHKWSHWPPSLCYGCFSCYGAVLYNIKMEWRHMILSNMFILLFLITVYLVRHRSEFLYQNRGLIELVRIRALM